MKNAVRILILLTVLVSVGLYVAPKFLINPITEENFSRVRVGSTHTEIYKLLGKSNFEGLIKDPSVTGQRRFGRIYINKQKTAQIRLYIEDGLVASAQWVKMTSDRIRPKRQGSANGPLPRNTGSVSDGYFTVELLKIDRPKTFNSYYWESGKPWTSLRVGVTCNPNPDDSCLVDPMDFVLVDTDGASVRRNWWDRFRPDNWRVPGVRQFLLHPVELSSGEAVEGVLLFGVEDRHPAILKFRNSMWLSTK